MAWVRISTQNNKSRAKTKNRAQSISNKRAEIQRCLDPSRPTPCRASPQKGQGRTNSSPCGRAVRQDVKSKEKMLHLRRGGRGIDLNLLRHSRLRRRRPRPAATISCLRRQLTHLQVGQAEGEGGQAGGQQQEGQEQQRRQYHYRQQRQEEEERRQWERTYAMMGAGGMFFAAAGLCVLDAAEGKKESEGGVRGGRRGADWRGRGRGWGDGGCVQCEGNSAVRMFQLGDRGQGGVQAQKHHSIKDNYDIGKPLGEGAYGMVYEARAVHSGERVAVKKISKSQLGEEGFLRELNTLKRIHREGGHPNIAGVKDYHEDNKFFYVIMELVSGGEMFEHLCQNGPYSEAKAAGFLRELGRALTFLHGQNIVHADLKPENIMLSSWDLDNSCLKVVDFGCSMSNGTSVDISSVPLGTWAYLPPEALKAGGVSSRFEMSPSVDMWAVGAILYVMLSGAHPFDAEGTAKDAEVVARIKRGDIPMSQLAAVSDSAKDLILRLMAVDPARRLSAKDMLNHPWVRGETASTDILQDSDQKLTRFQGVLRQKLETGFVSLVLASAVKEGQFSRGYTYSLDQAGVDGVEGALDVLKRVYSAFDRDGKGFISARDITRVLEEQGCGVVSEAEHDAMETALARRKKRRMKRRRKGNTPEEEGKDEQQQQRLGQEEDEEEGEEDEGEEGGEGEEEEDEDNTSSKWVGGTVASSSDSALDVHEFEELVAMLNNQHYPAGKYVFQEGALPEGLFFITGGKVEVLVRDEKGHQQRVACMGPGDFFGEGGLEKNVPRSVSIRAVTPLDAIFISKESCEQMFRGTQVAEALRSVAFTRSMVRTKRIVRAVHSIKQIHLMEGEVLIRQGEEGNSLFTVCSGELDVIKESESQRRKVARLAMGSFFGEMALLLKQPRTATVSCGSKEGCVVDEIKGNDFLKLVMAKSDHFKNDVMRLLRARQFRHGIYKLLVEAGRGAGSGQDSFTIDELKKVFDSVASGGEKGYITLDELEQALSRVDESLTAEQIREIMAILDMDSNGQVSYEEFLRIILWDP